METVKTKFTNMPPSYSDVAIKSIDARQRIKDFIYETPLLPARTVGLRQETKVLFKAENFQLTGSFKIRGAMAKMSFDFASGKLITASSGNHGVAAAHAASVLSKDLTIVLPESVLPAKHEKIKKYEVATILHGAETGLAEKYAQGRAATKEYTYISAYNDIDIIAGQGTIGLEILDQ
jgi:threonine dehydratase